MGQIIHCSHTDGVSGIIAALEKATHGDEVNIACGRYLVTNPISVSSGVTLRGAGQSQTIFVHEGHWPALQIIDADDVNLEHFGIESTINSTPRRALPETEPFPEDFPNHNWPTIEWGALWIRSSQSITVRNVHLCGQVQNHGLNGLCASDCRKIEILSSCIENYGGRGLTFLGVDDSKIISCEVQNCYLQGIAVSANFEAKISRSEIRDNNCHHNGGAGIGLFSSESADLRGNYCWCNGTSGIALECTPNAPAEVSWASIIENRCFDNKGSGIQLSKAYFWCFQRNQCRGNGGSGVQLIYSQENQGHQNGSIFSKNSLSGNKNSGLFISNGNIGKLINNDSWNNGIHGCEILNVSGVQEDKELSEISYNHFHSNGHSGLAIFSSQIDVIRNNNCWKNSYFGIILKSIKELLPILSKAEIVGNQCHENNQAGIALFSSESDNLSNNHCWDNAKSGIVIERSEFESAPPSKAIILGNKCHDNQQSGIAILSSESDDCRENECWNNNIHGIILIPATETADSIESAIESLLQSPAPKAKIIDNLCHRNGNSGIALFESPCELIQSNECWNNSKQGILISNTLSRPKIYLKENRCHSNKYGYTALNTDEIDFDHNFSWRNNSPPARTTIDDVFLGNIDEIFLDPEESVKATAARIRLKCHGGNISNILSKSNIPEPGLLSRYLVSHGAIDDLKRWQGASPTISPADDFKSEPLGATFKSVYRLHHQNNNYYANDDEADVVRFLQTSHSSEGAFWDIVYNHSVNKKPRKSVIAVVGNNQKLIDSMILEVVRADNQLTASELPDIHEAIDARDKAMVHLDMLGQRLAKPLVIDYTSRSQLALQSLETKTPFLEPGSPQGIHGILSRLKFLFLSPRFLRDAIGTFLGIFTLLIFLGFLKGAPNPLNNLTGTAWFSIKQNLMGLQITDVVEMIFFGSALGYFAFRLNSYLPAHLKFHRPEYQVRHKTDLQDENEPATPERKLPWRLWVKRKIYNGNVCTLVIRNVSEWLDADLIALRETIQMCPPDKSLIIIIETPSKTLLDRTLLRPFYDHEIRSLRMKEVELNVYLGHETESLQFDIDKTAIGLPVLLGTQSFGQRDQAAVEADILRPELSVADFLPMLVIGSTQYSPFHITLPLTVQSRFFSPDTEEAITQYAELFPGSTVENLKDSKALDLLRRYADKAASVTVIQRKNDRDKIEELVGRHNNRSDVASALADVFGTNLKARSWYVVLLLRCGELHALDQFKRSISQRNHIRPRWNQAFLTMRSAFLLRSEALRISSGIDDSDQATDITVTRTTDNWHTAINLFNNVSVNDLEPQDLMTISRIFALSLNAPDIKFNITTDLSSNKPSNNSPKNCFMNMINSKLIYFDKLDRVYAYSRCVGELRPIFDVLPESQSNDLHEMLNDRKVTGLDLAQFLDNAIDSRSLLESLRLNSGIKMDMVATLFSVLARHAETVQEQIMLAHKVAELTAQGVVISASARPRGVSRNLSMPLTEFCEILTDPEVISCLTLGDATENDKSVSLSDLIYGSRGSLQGSGTDKVRIEIF